MTELGERKAEFERLYDKHSGFLLNYARMKIFSTLYTKVDPEDLVQEAMLKVYDKFINGNIDPENFLQYCKKVIDNSARDILKNIAGGKQTADSPQIELTATSEAPGPLAILLRSELSRVERELPAILASLPTNQGDVARCILLEGMTHDETAKRLGIPPGTSMSSLSRARRKIAEILERTHIADGWEYQH